MPDLNLYIGIFLYISLVFFGTNRVKTGALHILQNVQPEEYKLRPTDSS